MATATLSLAETVDRPTCALATTDAATPPLTFLKKPRLFIAAPSR
jgi:hypothetical protein